MPKAGTINIGRVYCREPLLVLHISCGMGILPILILQYGHPKPNSNPNSNPNHLCSSLWAVLMSCKQVADTH